MRSQAYEHPGYPTGGGARKEGNVSGDGVSPAERECQERWLMAYWRWLHALMLMTKPYSEIAFAIEASEYDAPLPPLPVVAAEGGGVPRPVRAQVNRGGSLVAHPASPIAPAPGSTPRKGEST